MPDELLQVVEGLRGRLAEAAEATAAAQEARRHADARLVVVGEAWRAEQARSEALATALRTWLELYGSQAPTLAQQARALLDAPKPNHDHAHDKRTAAP